MLVYLIPRVKGKESQIRQKANNNNFGNVMHSTYTCASKTTLTQRNEEHETFNPYPYSSLGAFSFVLQRR